MSSTEENNEGMGWNDEEEDLLNSVEDSVPIVATGTTKKASLVLDGPEGSVTFNDKTVMKAQLGDEVRLVSGVDSGLKYEDFVNTLQTVFKDRLDSSEEIIVKYKDEDGDLVTITNSSDLLYAIQNNVLKWRFVIIPQLDGKKSGDIPLGAVRRELKDIQSRVNKLLGVLDKEEQNNLSRPTQTNTSTTGNAVLNGTATPDSSMIGVCVGDGGGHQSGPASESGNEFNHVDNFRGTSHQDMAQNQLPAVNGFHGGAAEVANKISEQPPLQNQLNTQNSIGGYQQQQPVPTSQFLPQPPTAPGYSAAQNHGIGVPPSPSAPPPSTTNPGGVLGTLATCPIPPPQSQQQHQQTHPGGYPSANMNAYQQSGLYNPPPPASTAQSYGSYQPKSAPVFTPMTDNTGGYAAGRPVPPTGPSNIPMPQMGNQNISGGGGITPPVVGPGGPPPPMQRSTVSVPPSVYPGTGGGIHGQTPGVPPAPMGNYNRTGPGGPGPVAGLPPPPSMPGGTSANPYARSAAPPPTMYRPT